MDMVTKNKKHVELNINIEMIIPQIKGKTYKNGF